MSNSILNGFCKCGHLVEADQINKDGTVWNWEHFDDDGDMSEACFRCGCGQTEKVIPFLLAKQIRILNQYFAIWPETKEEIHQHIKYAENGRLWVNLAKLLEEEPFLIAKILKNEGDK